MLKQSLCNGRYLHHQNQTIYFFHAFKASTFSLSRYNYLLYIFESLLLMAALIKFYALFSSQVADEYKLVADTLYLTVYLIDQFLSQNCIEMQKLQLLGITSMLIASWVLIFNVENICTCPVDRRMYPIEACGLPSCWGILFCK